MNTNRKVKVIEKTKVISEMSNQVLSLDYNSELLDIKDGDKIHVIFTRVRDACMLDQADYAMSGIEMESLTAEKGMTCVSFGGLLGRFKMKDISAGDSSKLAWYVFVRKTPFKLKKMKK